MKKTEFILKSILQPTNKLIHLQNKSMPFIEVDQKNNTLKNIQKNNADSIAARTSQPLSINESIAYFEVFVKESNQKNKLITIGLSQKEQQLQKAPGFTKNSIGFQSSGQLYYDKLKVTILQQYGKNDIVGCGVNYDQKQIFFTKNGTLIDKYTMKMTQNLTQYYPTGSVLYEKQCIQFNFGLKPFKFNLAAYVKKFRIQRSQNIINSIELQGECIYELIADYMYFNGYMSTLQKLNKLRGKKLQEQRKNYLIKDLNSIDYLKVSDIKLKAQINELVNQIKQSQIQEQIIQQHKTQKQEQIDFQSPEKMDMQPISPIKKNRIRIMSQAFDQNIGLITRKMSTQNKSLILKNMQSRKDSAISYGDYSLVYQKDSEMKQSQIKQQNKQQDKNELSRSFLQNQRLKIINLVKEKKLQQARKLIEQLIPNMFQLSKNLDYYFKGHMYLRYIRQGNHLQAVYYARKNNLYQQYKNIPFIENNIQKGILVNIGFNELISTIRFNAEQAKNIRLLSDEQFLYFSEYINRQILKYMGIIDKSKLELIMSQLKYIQQKFEREKLKGDRFTVFE